MATAAKKLLIQEVIKEEVDNVKKLLKELLRKKIDFFVKFRTS
jgi:hypothetical protein